MNWIKVFIIIIIIKHREQYKTMDEPETQKVQQLYRTMKRISIIALLQNINDEEKPTSSWHSVIDAKTSSQRYVRLSWNNWN